MKLDLDRSKSITYIRVGVFFLAALILFFIALLSIREVTFFKGSYILGVKFNFAEGMRPSSPVRFCGVDVGEVKKVVVKEKKEEATPYVIVFAKIQQDIRIPRDSYFFINSLSLFGEKYLEITPPEQIGDYLKEGELVEGISPIPLFNLFFTFNKTMKEVHDFIREGKIRTSFENTLSNLESASFQMKNLMDDIRNKQGTVGRLLYDDSLYEKTEEFIEDIKNNPWKLLYRPKDARR